jgi:hypothetical protein
VQRLQQNVALSAQYVIKEYDTPNGALFFQQMTPYGVAGYLHAQRIAGTIRISRFTQKDV